MLLSQSKRVHSSNSSDSVCCQWIEIKCAFALNIHTRKNHLTHGNKKKTNENHRQNKCRRNRQKKTYTRVKPKRMVKTTIWNFQFITITQLPWRKLKRKTNLLLIPKSSTCVKGLYEKFCMLIICQCVSSWFRLKYEPENQDSTKIRAKTTCTHTLTHINTLSEWEREKKKTGSDIR